MSGFMERFQNEILFSTRFSTTFSTIFSTIFRKYKKILYQYHPEQLLTTQLVLHKSPYFPPSFQKENLCSPLQKLLETSTFYHNFSQWMRCAILQINTNLLVIQQNINIFTQETLYPSLIQKKLDLSIASVFRNIPFLSLFLIMREVCNISNKY